MKLMNVLQPDDVEQIFLKWKLPLRFSVSERHELTTEEITMRISKIEGLLCLQLIAVSAFGQADKPAKTENGAVILYSQSGRALAPKLLPSIHMTPLSPGLSRL